MSVGLKRGVTDHTVFILTVYYCVYSIYLVDWTNEATNPFLMEKPES